MSSIYYNVTVPVTEENQLEREETCFTLGAESVTPQKDALVVLTRFPDRFVDQLNGTGSVTVKDWEYTWMENFKGGVLAPGILIKSYDKPLELEHTASDLIIELDPRDAFGDGLHATTQICTRLIKDICTFNPIKSAIDIGTGSGVLAILMNKLGVDAVSGFDIEPLSVQKATENCTRNGCADIKISEGDIATFSGTQTYDLVVGNLLTVIIESSIDSIIPLLSESGVLILSGIGVQWEKSILILLKSKGLYVIKKVEQDGWLGLKCSL